MMGMSMSIVIWVRVVNVIGYGNRSVICYFSILVKGFLIVFFVFELWGM